MCDVLLCVCLLIVVSVSMHPTISRSLYNLSLHLYMWRHTIYQLRVSIYAKHPVDPHNLTRSKCAKYGGVGQLSHASFVITWNGQPSYMDCYTNTVGRTYSHIHPHLVMYVYMCAFCSVYVGTQCIISDALL